MIQRNVDVAVIGAGPAGLAAALKARALGAEKVLLLERDTEAGGILQQCIHDGFGLHRFGRRMAGTEYAQVFIDELEKTDIELMTDTMVLEVTKDKTIYACSEKNGMLKISCGAVILAMGCRERTAGQIQLMGYRPAGVLTAGTVQRYINREGYLPGSRAVILGSGDIGLIMARRMRLEGMEVEGVYEVMPNPGGLTRNLVQCLDDFGIPLHLSTTVTKVHGKKRIEGVTVAELDEKRQAIPGTERRIDCDLLVLAVGLIPENELSIGCGIELDPRTKGPVLDDRMMTSVPGIFACGNVAVVYDLVDYVSASGEAAAEGAVRYLKGEYRAPEAYVKTVPAGNVSFIVPQRIAAGADHELTLYLRVKKPDRTAPISVREGEKTLISRKLAWLAPPEMLSVPVRVSGEADLTVEIGEGRHA